MEIRKSACILLLALSSCAGRKETAPGLPETYCNPIDIDYTYMVYNSWLTYGGNSLVIRSLSVDQKYWFTIEAFNENGISIQSPCVATD